MTIKTLFDPSKDIYRTIEKVITYSASQEERLKTEIREYIVTESIEEQFEHVLGLMQLAMEQGGANEVGVWVSGFYGSGKSSFTKYLGLAMDGSIEVDGSRFLRHLQDRMHRPQTKALLNTIATRYPAAVVMLDLASEMLAGATMEDVSTVLYYKVLQWAGYSRNIKVATLERRLQKEGRYQEFLDLIQREYGVPWADMQDDTLVVDSVLPEIAHQLYPNLFKTPTAFTTESVDIIRFETDRVQEMIDIVREISGKEYILFIIDEVGQYVAPRQHLILNLDGLAKNLKSIGDGKVWIVGTAQQTLTEDDPRAALNSAELYRLSARFPIQIDLESNDIKEICTVRLLGKSAAGAQTLGKLFDQHGQALRHNTKLEDARVYAADFNRETFVDLYPFLPAHFDILLYLLGALAKSTGGIGLRSAIKVIQEILVEATDGQIPVADQPVGWLATTSTLYDALESDIRRAFPSIYRSCGMALQSYRESPVHQAVAKTVAVLQILNNMPVTVQNIACLIHPSVDAASHLPAVEAAVQELIHDALVPFGEKDGVLVFFSEKINEIDRERAEISLRSIETRRIQNEALTTAFSPLPSTRLHNSLTVSAGLRAMNGSMAASLAGDRSTIQMVVEFVEETEYNEARTRLLEESRQRNARSTIFLLGRNDPEAAALVGEIYRCQEIERRYRNDPDQEVREYCTAQADRAGRLGTQLQRRLQRSLNQGSFLFRGQVTAVESIDHDLQTACKKHLGQVAEQVFDRYGEAPVRAETTLAEKFLRIGNLQAVTAPIDPLELVQISGGTPSINTDHRALLSIKDYLRRNELVEGKRLTDHFTDAPFGWSQDTLRYLVAALLVAGEIRLKVSGRDVTVNGQQALEALRTNNSFRTVGVAPRDDRPSLDTLARASERLTELTGDSVFPQEEDISKATARHVSQCQHRFGPMAEKLEGLGLPGHETVRALLREMADIMLTDASDAPQRLGGEESPFFDNLKWAAQIDMALKNGLDRTVRSLQHHLREIDALPDAGIPGQLRTELWEEIAQVRQRLGHESFYKHMADLSSALSAIQAQVRSATKRMAEAQDQSIADAHAALQRLPEWSALSLEEQQEIIDHLEDSAIQPTLDIDGMRSLLVQDFVVQSKVSELKTRIAALGKERADPKSADGGSQVSDPDGNRYRGAITVTSPLTSKKDLADLIQRLQSLNQELSVYQQVEITITIEK